MIVTQNQGVDEFSFFQDHRISKDTGIYERATFEQKLRSLSDKARWVEAGEDLNRFESEGDEWSARFTYIVLGTYIG